MAVLPYTCIDLEDQACPDSCVSLEACKDCGCVLNETDAGGPWGEGMDVALCLLPIFFLIVATVKSNPLPTTQSLPMAAMLLYLVRLMYLESDPLLATAAVISGLCEALTPLSIMGGAIFLFETMESTYCMPYMMREMKALTAGHPIAELMLLFAFAYLVEGASGFGTPVALAAPMLVSVGHPATGSVIVMLLFNTFATVWGAVGTPVWFGLGSLMLTEEEQLSISMKAGVALCVSAFLLIPPILSVLVPFKMVRENLLFIYLSLACTVGPSMAIACFNFEFPALAGGLIGIMGTIFLTSFNVGLCHIRHHEDSLGRSPDDIATTSDHGLVRRYEKMSSQGVDESTGEEGGKDCCSATVTTGKEMSSDTLEITGHRNRSYHQGPIQQEWSESDSLCTDKMPATLQDSLEGHLGPRKSLEQGYLLELVKRTFPIWGVVALLILTRVEQIGVKSYLVDKEPHIFSLELGTFGTLKLSTSLVFQLENILLYPGIDWSYAVLYVPFLVPFMLVSMLTLMLYSNDLAVGPADLVQTVLNRLRNPAIALFGALSLVQLMIRTGSTAPATLLGNILADWFQEGFIVASPLLGALGSFFSGSTTVSNLTFGRIQQIAAMSIDTSGTTMLALQAVGASAGNGVCLNNIIAACAVVGTTVGEGTILMQTYKFVLANTTIATLVMLVFFFRF